jgi:septum formation protein
MSSFIPRFVLASASPARRRLLEAAGLHPEVLVSGVDETTDIPDDPAAMVACLAARKAEAVAALVGPGALVLGCDSVLDVDGVAHGKPASADEATTRWKVLRGREAVLRTGHCLIDTTTGQRAAQVGATVVRFGSPSDAELAAYVATGEPLAVAGAFTLDGFAAPFIDGVDGDPGTVIGVSLPLLRTLLGRLDREICDLWA